MLSSFVDSFFCRRSKPSLRPERSVQLGVRVDVELKNKLNELVKENYKGLKGGLRMEVEAALRSWIDAQHTAKHTKISDPSQSKALMWCNLIASRLQKSGFESVSRKDLATVIGAYRGTDPRTLNKWTNSLLAFGYIQHTQNPVVFAIVKDKILFER